MSRTAVVLLVVLALLLVAGGWYGWQRIDALQGRVAELGDLSVTLGDRLDEAESRAEVAEARAAAEEARAREAEERAEAAFERAGVAETEAESATVEAETERGRALAALAEAEQAAEKASREREERERAERLAEEARTAARLAQVEADEALRKAAELREKRREDLNRLERAMERIAETRRTKLGLVMNLGDSIEFDFNRAELRPEARETLARIAGVLITAEDFRIQVFGHTDDVGSASYNEELSERRAAAVRDYLVEAGIDPGIISIRGYGKSQPLVEGTSPEARQRNRRVEVAVVQMQGELEGVAEESSEGG